eukprot:5972198-Alexandrium_andersonii.AAC.1
MFTSDRLEGSQLRTHVESEHARLNHDLLAVVHAPLQGLDPICPDASVLARCEGRETRDLCDTLTT